MRTTIVGQDAHSYKKSNRQKLVWIHGFCGSGTLFFQCFKQLSENYLCFFIDIIGMGESSRPKNIDVANVTPEENLDYYLNYLEIWR